MLKPSNKSQTQFEKKWKSFDIKVSVERESKWETKTTHYIVHPPFVTSQKAFLSFQIKARPWPPNMNPYLEEY